MRSYRPRSKVDEVLVRENREKVLKVFAEMRKEGFIARSNFLCCGNCAGYAIAEKVSQMSAEKAKTVKGCVFWHHQDEETIWEYGTLYLRYGDLDTTGHGTVGLPNEECGKILTEKLRAKGLKVEWNGDGGTCVKVDMNYRPYVNVGDGI